MPDMEAAAYALLRDLGGISVWAYTANARWPFLSEQVALQVDVRASTKKRARDRAYTARDRLLSLPGTAGVVAAVDVEGGPMWAPDEDGAPRYVLRVAVTTRAARLMEGSKA
jgi:hypothetical protein